MKIFRPKSILQLILIGFAVVALPLVIALIYAAVSVDKLAVQSQRLISGAVRATEGGRVLVDQITAMERNLRQYQVLGDDKLLRVYEDNRALFVDTLTSLSILPLPDALRHLSNHLSKEEAQFNAGIPDNQDALRQLNVSESFEKFANQARQIVVLSQRLIDEEVEKSLESAQQARRNLFWQASALVPVVVLLLVIVMVLIRQPLRRLDEAIRRLGDGDFSVALKLEGPRDLEQLGERLDWMRIRLMEVEEDKQRFLRHISHELKTPLTSIREGSELLAEEIAGTLTGQQREIVELMHQNGVQLQKLIEGLLDYNAATRNPGLNLQSLRLDKLVDALIDEYKVSVMAKRLQFDVDLAKVNLIADAEKLRIILDNLLSNAVKFSPSQGRIKIIVGQDDKNALVDVQDEGPGISAEQREKIFEAFYQGSAPYTGHVSGTGLGLSIVREYLHMHDGAIEVVSGAGGAHMRVCLPLEQELKSK